MTARVRMSISLLAAVLLAGCDRNGGHAARFDGEYQGQSVGGVADRGARLIGQYGCGACHTVPGIRRARGRVGPPLNFFAERSFIAGQLPNTPETLVRWIMDPPGLIPATGMPRLDVSERDARDITAYLYTLH